MHNLTQLDLPQSVVAGCDVGKDYLDVVRRTSTEHGASQAGSHRRFTNTASGHRDLIRWRCRSGG